LGVFCLEEMLMVQRNPSGDWRNPCGAILLTPEVREKYRAAHEDLQSQWYERWPDIDKDPLWFTRRHPEAAVGYPPGFLKRNLNAAVIFMASAPDTDGYFWANDQVQTGVDSYAALDTALEKLAGPVDMLILSGEELALDEACGVCWREYNTSGLDSRMPARTAELIHSRITPSGLLVLGSCRAGDHPDLVQQMANVVGRPAAGAQGTCRGVRQELLVENGIPWTLGGYAEGNAWTLALPQPSGLACAERTFEAGEGSR
jgi:hypothetical protein